MHNLLRAQTGGEKMSESNVNSSKNRKLTKEERSENARIAARARWSGIRNQELRQALGAGTLNLADLQFRCAVLDDGSRVISGTEFMKTMGIYRSGALSTRRYEDDSGIYVPLYLAHKNLQPYIKEDKELVESLSKPIVYRDIETGSVAEGIPGQVLRRVCSVWKRANRDGVLGPSQEKVAAKAEKLVDALADVAIVALIDEATGYQKRREKDELQKILAAYISPELLPWTSKFPREFYKEMFRVWGWQWPPRQGAEGGPQGPRYAGKLTKQLIYENLPPGVLEEIEKKNPANSGWQRKNKHFQHLTEDIGHPHVEKLVAQITLLFRISSDKQHFWKMYRQAFPKKGDQLDLLPYDGDPEIR